MCIKCCNRKIKAGMPVSAQCSKGEMWFKGSGSLARYKCKLTMLKQLAIPPMLDHNFISTRTTKKSHPEDVHLNTLVIKET